MLLAHTFLSHWGEFTPRAIFLEFTRSYSNKIIRLLQLIMSSDHAAVCRCEECQLALPTVPIADSHCHYWTPSTHRWLHELSDPNHPFHKLAPLCRPYMPKHHLDDLRRLDLRETVYIQADMHDGGHFTPVEEVAWVDGISAAVGRPNAVIGYAPLHEPEAATKVLDACSRYRTFRGVRFMLDFHPTRPELCQTDRGDYMTDPAFRQGLEKLGERQLLFELQVCQCQLSEAADLAAAVPSLTFLLNHAGFPLRGQYDEWRRGIAKLASRPNVACKLGAFGAYDDPAFSAEETRQYVGACLDLFGVDRCLMASNLPVDRVDQKPAERWASLWGAVQGRGLSDEQLRNLFRGNALRYYRIEDRIEEDAAQSTNRTAQGDLASKRRRYE